ncbi:hypothetical protein GMLC_04830 [Geomonas limicola]|uniref:Uncharacterized protein n=1 Tax=Geomonas limicola TaxID=2740186 RepID=A0A6V8N4M1_9BACT|nr:hypothetical protein [Geomonas limicola]GFO66904.1 hypothetical protein GMLC_04830 [Geomonas limicola]
MTIRLKLKPGQKGTWKLQATYGDDLVCLRYRYEAEAGQRIKTAEIIVERKPWKQSAPHLTAEQIVSVRIGREDKPLQAMAKAASGKWDSNAKVWRIPYGKIKGSDLE